MHTKATKYAGRKLGSYKLNLTIYTGNEWNWPICLLVNPSSQPSLDTSSTWISVISEEVGKLQHSSLLCFMRLLQFCISYDDFHFLFSVRILHNLLELFMLKCPYWYATYIFYFNFNIPYCTLLGSSSYYA
jgi:hypothetical protein